MISIDDVIELDKKPLSHMLPVSVDQNRIGHLTIKFQNKKSLYVQSDYDIIDVLFNIVQYKGEYYIYDEYLPE